MRIMINGSKQFIGVQIYLGSSLDKIKGNTLINILKEIYNVGQIERDKEKDITTVTAFIPNPIKVPLNSEGDDKTSLEYISKTKELLCKFDEMQYSLGSIIFDKKKRKATSYIDLEGLHVTTRVDTLPKYCL